MHIMYLVIYCYQIFIINPYNLLYLGNVPSLTLNKIWSFKLSKSFGHHNEMVYVVVKRGYRWYTIDIDSYLNYITRKKFQLHKNTIAKNAGVRKHLPYLGGEYIDNNFSMNTCRLSRCGEGGGYPKKNYYVHSHWW